MTVDTSSGAGSQAVRGREVAVRAPSAVMAERRAWLILWLAFATFLVLVGSAVKFISEYVSTAEIDVPAQVESSRGHVFVQRPAGTTELLSVPRLAQGTVVTAERDSEGASASLRLFDQTRVTVQTGAIVELSRMQVGRFINQHDVLLTQTAGQARYETAAAADVSVPNGTVHLGPRADASVWIDGQQTRVLVYEGEARLESNNVSGIVAKDQQASIFADRRIGEPQPRATPLLANGDFSQHDDGWQKHDKPDNSQLDVPGQRFWVSGPDEAGHPLTALQIKRTSVRLEHGETGLIRPLNVNVEGFRHLWLQAWVRVDSASLSGGGQLGSEYPMMLIVHYEGPEQNSRPDWTHGFYIANDESRPVRDAEEWPAGTWKQYRVDLMDTDASRLPYRLLDLAVMGQGHSYDARIADVQLVGE